MWWTSNSPSGLATEAPASLEFTFIETLSSYNAVSRQFQSQGKRCLAQAPSPNPSPALLLRERRSLDLFSQL